MVRLPLVRFSFPPAPSLLGSESSANRLLIAQKLARKILADNHAGWGGPDSCDASQDILARNSGEFILFAERILGHIAATIYLQFPTRRRRPERGLKSP